MWYSYGCALVMWIADWEGDSGDGEEVREPQGGEVGVVYMNIGGGSMPPMSFWRGAHGGMWLWRLSRNVGSRRGWGLRPSCIRTIYCSVPYAEGGRVACHMRRDLALNYCMLVVCENWFVCVEQVGARIVRVNSNCGARVDEMLQWLKRVWESVGSDRWVLLGNLNSHHVC